MRVVIALCVLSVVLCKKRDLLSYEKEDDLFKRLIPKKHFSRLLPRSLEQSLHQDKPDANFQGTPKNAEQIIADDGNKTVTPHHKKETDSEVLNEIRENSKQLDIKFTETADIVSQHFQQKENKTGDATEDDTSALESVEDMNDEVEETSDIPQIVINGKLRNETEMECNRDFLSIFSLYGARINNAYQTTFEDHNFCFTDYSCCSNEHFDNILSLFAKRINSLRSSFKPFIQLLAFFRGKSIARFIRQHQASENCINILKDDRPNGLNFINFDLFEDYRKLVVSFIDQLKDFVNMKEQWFGNLLCSICSPKIQERIVWNEDDKILEFPISPQICNTIYKFQSMEVKMLYLYRRFVLKIADFVECASGLTAKGFGTKRRFIFSFNEYELNTTCYNQFNFENIECLKTCSKGINLFKNNMLFMYNQHIIQTLKLFYKVFAKGDISKHYENDLKQNFERKLVSMDFAIFPINTPIGIKYNLSRAQMVFTEDAGINPYLTPISFGFWNQIDYLIDKM